VKLLDKTAIPAFQDSPSCCLDLLPNHRQ